MYFSGTSFVSQTLHLLCDATSQLPAASGIVSTASATDFIYNAMANAISDQAVTVDFDSQARTPGCQGCLRIPDGDPCARC